jgi:hypothetical protein
MRSSPLQSVGSCRIGNANYTERVDEGRGLIWIRPNERETDPQAVCLALDWVERVGTDTIPQCDLDVRLDSIEPIV